MMTRITAVTYSQSTNLLVCEGEREAAAVSNSNVSVENLAKNSPLPTELSRVGLTFIRSEGLHTFFNKGPK